MNGPDRQEPFEDPDRPESGADAGAEHRADRGERKDARRPPRIPLPRTSIEDTGAPLPDPPVALTLDHRVLKSLLGAWALAACSVDEAIAVEEHLGHCGPCAEEALRLRDAVGLLHREESLDLDPSLRNRVIESCLGRRPPRIPVPEWAMPYDAETARLDALLRDIGASEWHAPVDLRWFDEDRPVSRRTTVAGVIAHLLAVDGLVALALGLDDPLGGEGTPPFDPSRRTEAYWSASYFPPTRAVRGPWREQTHELIRTVSFTAGGAHGSGSGRLAVPYSAPDDEGRRVQLPLRDSMLERAFECWIHAGDIADAVDYPYEPPSPRHLHRMIDLAARLLPGTLAERRRSGLADPAQGLVAAGAPGRSLRLEIEGLGGGEWFIPLDSPGADASADREVAHVALDGVEFCRLAAGHVSPQEAAAGQDGDRRAIKDVLFAAASLSRM
ncbi:MDMPI N domain containing protein [Streptomyces sp. NPDC058257]|uniref:MDMPI N domain containing protein n=1 Tax=Streptomyces sp. NPDC058257 TaxID=3346409 RepID=UPI0036F01164